MGVKFGYMKKIVVSILLLLSLTMSLMAQNVTITGRVNRHGTLVRLLVCDDLLNRHETVIAETSSDENGFFMLEGKVEETLPASIAVGLERVDMILCPGASYEVSIVIPEMDRERSYFERETPTLRIKTATDKGICRQVFNADQIINYYVLTYVDELFRRHQYKYLDSIKDALDQEMDVKNEYVERYNTYKVASVQMAVNADGGKRVIEDYYDGNPVYYTCESYMDLFKDLFRNYTVTEEFGERNPRLAEMITLFQLKDAYYGDVKLRKKVRNQLHNLKEKSKFAETRKMAVNMLSEFDRFAKGADAPDFELSDVNGNRAKLSDYKDKLVLLQFVEGSSALVNHQFESLATLHRQWQDSVQLITVTTKDQLANHRKRFEDHHYDWPLLDLGNEILLLERYEVRTFPEYFIILPGTKIGMAPAPALDGGMEKAVRKLYGE